MWPGEVGQRSCSRAQGGARSRARSGKVELLPGAMYNREREEWRHGKLELGQGKEERGSASKLLEPKERVLAAVRK